MRHFCPVVEPGGRATPRGDTGSRQCLCWTPSSTISSRYRPTLRSWEAWSSARRMALCRQPLVLFRVLARSARVSPDHLGPLGRLSCQAKQRAEPASGEEPPRLLRSQKAGVRALLKHRSCNEAANEALGQSRHFDRGPATSGLPRTTDIIGPGGPIRFVP
jgi:hypothetical protein